MGYFQFRYDSIVVIYYCRGFIRLATDGKNIFPPPHFCSRGGGSCKNSHDTLMLVIPASVEITVKDTDSK